MSVFWGPVVGAKVLSARTAVILQVGCQVLGHVALGPHYLTGHTGVLRQGSTFADSPSLVLYALLCVSFVLLVWHLLAYWQQVPLPPYSMLGKDHWKHRQQEVAAVSCTSRFTNFDIVL